MSETGATEAQIEMAETLADAIATYFDFGEGHNDLRWQHAYRIGLHAAGRLPDHRIVPAADAITPELRAAIEYVVSFLDGYKAPEQIGCAVWDVADLLKAAVEKGGK